MVDNHPTLKDSNRVLSSKSSSLLDILPIDLLQKDAVISDNEVKNHSTITIKVNNVK